jgi:formylglycine-generating enzyme required for sulfatase activity
MTTLFISHSSRDNDWAAELREVLRDEGYQWLFLDFHPDDGIHTGEEWEQTLYQKINRCRAIVPLCSGHWLDSPWCVAEALLAREKGKRIFPLVTPDVDPHKVPFPDRQCLRLKGITRAQAHARLCKDLEAAGLKDDFPPPARPYPGLKPFDEDDAAIFFGRRREIEKVQDALNLRRDDKAPGFLVVLGASGCGKSSLVRAGVLPRLRGKGANKGREAKADWVIPAPFMGGDGLDGLAKSLAVAFNKAGAPNAFTALRDRLGLTKAPEGDIGHAGRALSDMANELLVARHLDRAHVLLVVDQLEEVFSPVEESDASALLGLLLAATHQPASPVVVLATLRSDFLNAFQLFPGASERYQGITLDPMPRERFGEVIEGPAERFGLALQPGLTERLVADTTYSDALPLLAYTLERLYEQPLEQLRTQGSSLRTLTLDAYEALFPPVVVQDTEGKQTEYRGVAAAIKHVADQILDKTGYRDLPQDSPRRRDLRRAFYRLAEVGEAGQFTRRVASRTGMPESCREVLGHFVAKRLLVSSAQDGEHTLSVAHEALFRVWDTLREWLIQDRQALRLRAQIVQAAKAWDQGGRVDTGAAPRWPEERIVDAMRGIDRSGVSLQDVEDPALVQAFLGPTEREALEALPLCSAEQATPYGGAWHLPLAHEARASVGVRLALLEGADRRKGVALREDGLPDIDWCPVDAGAVTIDIRSNPDVPDSEVIDTVTRTVDPFTIARYPVTVAQFQAFIDACYQGGRWVLPAGCPVPLPDDYPPPKHRARYANHPADSVNWWDAITFCAWLSQQLGCKVRLPTEFEWQRAATGGESSKKYPWGDDWDPAQEPWRANTYESELGRSTAVGLYPHGISPAGVLDMAGTVWEWCLNAFDNPDEVGLPTAADDAQVLRGGSWSNNQDHARCTFRCRDAPIYRDVGVGFRVLCSSHIFLVLLGRGALGCRCECVDRCLSSAPACFQKCPPTTVCGPRRRGKDGAGASRPHGVRAAMPSSRRAYTK